MKEIYVVTGYMNTGSGSLTFPEDFDTKGFYLDKKDAQDHVTRLNKENGIDNLGEWLNEDDNDEPYEDMVYFVDTLKNLGKE